MKTPKASPKNHEASPKVEASSPPPAMEMTREEAIKENKRLAKTRKQHDEAMKSEKEIIANATLENVYKTVGKYLHINDYNRIDLILATALTNQISGTPIWMFIVGNSGDWKSAFARSLEGLRNVIKVDTLTKNTLASGLKNADDLGSQLQHSNTILLFPDLATLTSLNKDDKNIIWGQFRNLYDGFINKRTGSGVNKEYECCHVTIIACTTQAIRDEILIHAQLGTRELMYDTDTDVVDNNDKMDKAWENENIEHEMQQEIQRCVCDFLTYTKIKKITIPKDIKEFLKEQSSRLAILRASAIPDRRHQELLNPVYPEVPTRVIKQFKRLYIALKSLSDEYPDSKCKDIIKHIVDSSGNKTRQRILTHLIHNKNWFKIPELKHELRLSRESVKIQLEILWNMDIIEKKEEMGRIGGYVDISYGEEVIKGGRMEEVSYYRFKNQRTID